jgi:hypothetical protein
MVLLLNPHFFRRNLARFATHGPQDAFRKNIRPPVEGQRSIQSVSDSLKEYAKAAQGKAQFLQFARMEGQKALSSTLENTSPEKAVVVPETVLESGLEFIRSQVVRPELYEVPQIAGKKRALPQGNETEGSLLSSSKGKDLMHKSKITFPEQFVTGFGICVKIGFVEKRIAAPHQVRSE